MVYQSTNGKVFDNQQDCKKEDLFVEDVNRILAPFNDCKIRSEQFVQRSAEQVQNLIDETYRLLCSRYGEKSEIAELWKKNPRGFVGRYLDDGNSSAYSIYTVLLSIDSKNRQWEQPYFALFANKGEYPR